MAKIALGRGLEALIPTSDAATAAQSGKLQPLPLDSIAPNPHQPRKSFDQDKLSELAASIKEKGLLQPLLVKKDGTGYIVVAGERRYRAAKLAELKSVPALILDDIDDTDMLQIALIENLQREDLNPIETANAYRALIEQCDWSQAELADRVGKNRASVTNTLRLLLLPERIRRLVAGGKLTEGHARAILSVTDPAMREKIADRIISETLSVRQAESVARTHRRKTAPGRGQRNPFLDDAETRLKHTLGTAVRIVSGKKKGKIEIEYYGEDDLTRLMDLFQKI